MERFLYHGNGNLRRRTQGAIAYELTYNGFGHLVDYGSSRGLIASLITDGEGRRVAKITLAGTHLYHYDAANRILFEEDATGAVTDYIYANGHLVAKRVDEPASDDSGGTPPGGGPIHDPPADDPPGDNSPAVVIL